MILMLKDIENLNNTVKNVFVEYGLECDINFLYSQYPDRSDIKCNELLKDNNLCLTLIGKVLLEQGNYTDGINKLKAGEGVIQFDLKLGLSIS